MWKLNVAKDKIENWIFRLGDVEIFVREATCDQPWGPSDADYEKARAMSFQPSQMPNLMQTLWDRVTSEKSSWRNVYKSLLIINYLILNGPEILPTLVKGKADTLMQLKTRTYPDDTYKRERISIFTLAQKILKVLSDEASIAKERKKAKNWRERKAAGVLNSISSLERPDSSLQPFDNHQYTNESQNTTRPTKTQHEAVVNRQPSSANNIPWTSSDTLKEIDEKLEKIRINIPNYQKSPESLTISANNTPTRTVSDSSRNLKNQEPPLIDFAAKSTKDTLFDDLDVFSNTNLTSVTQNQPNNLIRPDNQTSFNPNIFEVPYQDPGCLLQNNSILTTNTGYQQNFFPDIGNPQTAPISPKTQFQGFGQFLPYDNNTNQYIGNLYSSNSSGITPTTQSQPKKKDSFGLDDLLAENINVLSGKSITPKPQHSPNIYFTNPGNTF